ncbi:MAG: arylsulfatase [Chloroherpetonaceae bacterium]|nr:arylsulfatase [Chloroherpetonaceae bacterium]
MKNKYIMQVKLGCFLFLGLTNLVFSQDTLTTNSKPNIVLILVDDSGLMDFGAFGGEARTPNIDRLAGGGIMFTYMHTSPVCSPSRAMLLTGTDSHLAGVANLPEFLPEEYQSIEGYEGVLNNRVQTIATRLKEANYNTYALGKWHLGHDENTLPNKRGFDRSFILGGSGASNYDNSGYLPMKPVAHWYADGQEVELPEDFYSSKSYIDKVISFHQEEQKKGNPFFSYLAFQAIHAPIQAPKSFVEKYKEIYKKGWNKLRNDRFEKAKELGLIPANTPTTDALSGLKKWEELSSKEQEKFIMSMAVTAGMLEAMDYHIGRYIEYLTSNGLLENTIFIVTSDNGPDGGDYKMAIPWALTHGYHRDYDEKGEKGYYGYIGAEFANGLSSPFSFFKYYTGEGGLRVPLIITGKNIPKSQRTDAFCFFTDIAPTIYELVGITTSAKEGEVPITGKSLLSHIKDFSQPVYGEEDGVGLEAAGSSAYFLNGFKIVKNNIPLGDNQWYLYNIQTDPTESHDLAAEKPELFQKMLADYEAYERRVGVVKMPKGYSTSGEVAKKSTKQMLWNWIPYLLILVVGVLGLVFWFRRRK